jgi:GT2 family glycosyltransferase
VNFGSHELIEANLSTDLLAGGRGVIVIVDNYSSAEESAAIVELCMRRGFVPVVLEENLGFGAGMSVGVARAIELGSTTLILINPDAIITGSTVASLAAQCGAEPMTLVSPLVLRSDGSTWFGGGRVLVPEGITTTAEGSDSTSPDGWLSGACLAISAQLWDACGGFDNDYFLYWEDIDLSWRCVRAGGRLMVRADLTVVHSVGGTQGGSGKSPLYVYYNCRNRLLFARKHLSSADIRRWQRRSARFAYRVVLRGGRRAFLRHPFSLGWAAVRGTIDGTRHTRVGSTYR